jgi:MFS family permease
VLSSSQRFLIGFACLNAAMGLGVGLAKVVTPLYALSLGADEATLGLVAAAQSAGVLCLGMPTGLLVERFGPVALFTAGSLLGGALYLLLPLYPGGLVPLTFAISCCMPLRFVPLTSLFFEQLETLGEAKAGWARGSHMGGSTVLGPLLAGLLAAFMTQRQMYWVIAALFLVTMAAARALFGAGRTRSASREPLRAQLRRLIADADVRAACTVDLVAMAILGFFNFFVVVIAVRELGLGAESASGLVSAHGGSYVLVLFGAGSLAARLGQPASYALAVLSIALGLVALGSSATVEPMLLGSVLLGGGIGLLHVVNTMRLARIGARIGRGKIAGLNALTGPAGSIAASITAGVVGARSGLQSVFLLFVPIVALLLYQPSAGGARKADAR